MTRALRSEKGTKVFLMTCTDVKDQLGFLLSMVSIRSVRDLCWTSWFGVLRTCCFQHLVKPLAVLDFVSQAAINLIEGSLEVKLPTIWTDGNGTVRKKLRHGESQKGADKRWRR